MAGCGLACPGGGGAGVSVRVDLAHLFSRKKPRTPPTLLAAF